MKLSELLNERERIQRGIDTQLNFGRTRVAARMIDEKKDVERRIDDLIESISVIRGNMA